MEANIPFRPISLSILPPRRPDRNHVFDIWGIILYAIYRNIKLKESVSLWMLGAGILAFFNEGNLEGWSM